ADVVHALAQMRKEIADHRAALPAWAKFPQRLEQHLLLIRQSAADAQRLAISGEESRFRIEGIHVRDPAVRENEDHSFCFGGKWRRLRRERIGNLRARF